MKWFVLVFVFCPLLLWAKVDYGSSTEIPVNDPNLEKAILQDLRTKNLLSIEERIQALVLLGRIRLAQKNYRESLGYLVRAKQLNPQNLRNYSQRYNFVFATLFEEVGAVNLANHYYMECSQSDTEDFHIYLDLSSIGRGYLQGGNYQQAIHFFT